MVPHSHATLEFSYITSGEIVLDFFSQKTQKMERVNLFQKQFFLVRPGCFHAVNIPYGLSTIGIEFYSEGDLIKNLSNSKYLNSLPSFTNILDSFEDVLIFNDTQNVWFQSNKFKDFNPSNSDKFDDFLFDIEIKKFVIEILKCSPESLNTLQKYNPYIKHALLFIESNISKDIKISDIASFLDISEVYLQRLFKSFLNTSVDKFIQKNRIDKAKMLISNTNFPLSKIAKEVGYNSPQVFINNFKKITGVSPSNYKATDIHNNDLYFNNILSFNYNEKIIKDYKYSNQK